MYKHYGGSARRIALPTTYLRSIPTVSDREWPREDWLSDHFDSVTEIVVYDVPDKLRADRYFVVDH